MLRKLLAALGVGLLVCGTAVASHLAEPTVTITSAKVTAKWKESYMKGFLAFSGTASSSVSILASVRSVTSNKLVAAPLGFGANGAFAKKITLGARPVPGSYRLHLEDPTTGNSLADKIVKIPAPPEGVIDVAYMTNTKKGRRMKVIRNAKIIYAHFHFVARPQTKTLTFKWQKPGNPKVRFTGFASKRYSTTVDTFVCIKKSSGGLCLGLPLAKGKWYCIVMAKGRVVKRQDVRVT